MHLLGCSGLAAAFVFNFETGNRGSLSVWFLAMIVSFGTGVIGVSIIRLSRFRYGGVLGLVTSCAVGAFFLWSWSGFRSREQLAVAGAAPILTSGVAFVCAVLFRKTRH